MSSQSGLTQRGLAQSGHAMTNSHLLVQAFEYFEPATLDEAVAILDEHGDRAHVLAGGTFLLVQWKMEQIPQEFDGQPGCLVNIGKLPGLDTIRAVNGYLEIGPLASIWDLSSSAMVRRAYPALAEACAAFGSTQIQMTGTIGGNICNGSPASDTVPALVALDARVVLIGPDGERTLPIHRFLIGPGETAIGRGELLKAVRIPRPEPRARVGSAFVKISRVRADLAKASAAATLVRDGETIVDCRLALGSVGPTVVRARTAEQLLIGQPLTAESALVAGRAAAAQVTPIDDVRSSAWYRREVLKALTHDALQLAWSRAAEQNNGDAEEQGGAAPAQPERPRQELHPIHLGAHESSRITLRVDGEEHCVEVAANELLINVLRERLNLTGTKYGCGIGECGACTVHLDGVPTLACLTLAVAVDGRQVTTVEGLQGADHQLDPLQEAFIESAGFQCGYCTPGILMMTKRLLEEKPEPNEDDVRDYLKGNRCRCTGFASIVRAVMSCAERREG